jgi:hypothetical protein
VLEYPDSSQALGTIDRHCKISDLTLHTTFFEPIREAVAHIGIYPRVPCGMHIAQYPISSVRGSKPRSRIDKAEYSDSEICEMIDVKHLMLNNTTYTTYTTDIIISLRPRYLLSRNRRS